MSEILIYKTPDNKINVEMKLANETLWLPQNKIAELFGVNKPAISKHIKNIYESQELDMASTVSKMETVQNEGGREIKRQIDYYNLDMIIAVGYRINSKQATHFRIWATDILKEYIIKGFVMNDKRLMEPNKSFGADYFDELLERIRKIRASERRFYQKITDIYAQCSSDYDKNSQETKDFYATVQNKFHYAITGKTAAEIIHERADSNKQYMGLTSWKNSPAGEIRKNDVTIAKNYLTQDELDIYNRIVSMYLEFAEIQAKNKKIMTQHDWIEKLNAFLTINDRDILKNKGSVSMEMAIKSAYNEYEKYSEIQMKDYISDFDETIKKLDKK